MRARVNANTNTPADPLELFYSARLNDGLFGTHAMVESMDPTRNGGG